MQDVSGDYLATLSGTAQPLIWRVELLATSGFSFPSDVEAVATASSVKNTYSGSGTEDDFFAASNVTDGQATEAVKYAACDYDECLADSGFCCVGVEGDNLLSPGWWSEIESDAFGEFSTSPYVEVTYSQAVEANAVRVTTTGIYSGLGAVNVQVKYAGSGSYTDLGDHEFGSGTRVTVSLGEVKQVAAIKITAIATKRPTQPARILEVEPVLEFTAESLGSIEGYVTDITVAKSSGELTTMQPAGPGFGINRLTMEIAKGCPIEPTENQLVRVLAGFSEGELLAQGVFVITEVNEHVHAWSVTAHGLLSISAYHKLPDWVFQDQKTSELITTLLNWAGFSEGGITFDLVTDPTWEWYVLEEAACSEALGKIAQVTGVAIYEDEQANIRVKDDYGSSVLTLTDGWISDINRTKPQEVNYVQVHYGSYRLAAEDEILSGSGDLDASATQTYTFSLSKTPAVQIMPPTVDSFKDEENNDLTPPTITGWYADAYSLTVTLHNNTNTAGSFRLSARGIPLDKPGDEAIYEAKDLASMRRHGVRPYEAPPLYTSSREVAQAYGDRLLAYMRYASGALTLNVNRPLLHLQLRDVVTVDSPALGINGDYVVLGIELSREDTTLQLIPIEAVT